MLGAAAHARHETRMYFQRLCKGQTRGLVKSRTRDAPFDIHLEHHKVARRVKMRREPCRKVDALHALARLRGEVTLVHADTAVHCVCHDRWTRRDTKADCQSVSGRCWYFELLAKSIVPSADRPPKSIMVPSRVPTAAGISVY